MNNKIKIPLLFSLLLISAIFIPQKSFAIENLFNVDTNTVALWRFNEVSGSTVIDSAGVNNGTAIGTTIVDGKFGKARYFNGINEYITVPDNSSLRNLSQITIEAWVYPSGFDLSCWTNIEHIIGKGPGDASNAYNLRIWRNAEGGCSDAQSFNQLHFNMVFGGIAVPSTWYSPNQWYYVAGTYDGDYVKLYINGKLESQYYAPNLIMTNTDPLFINRHTWSSGSSQGRMQGIIDEIRISNTARSAEEIAYYYNLATIIPTFVDFDPDTLNLKSQGKWVTTYIELPIGYNLNDIDLGSIRLNNQIPIESKPIEIRDYNKNRIPDLMVKFNRSAVQNILLVGKTKITISGKLNNGRLFEGSDIIRVIKK